MPLLFLPLLLLLLVIVLSSSRASDECVAIISTREERAALFDYLFNATLGREAFSRIKNERLNITENMLKERTSLINANSDEDLFYALVRLSNVRKDRHLFVRPVEGGIWLDEYWGPRPFPFQQPPLKETSIRFATDYSNHEERLVFVSDYAVGIMDEGRVEIGNVLVKVNDVPFDDYVAELEPYVCYSTIDGFWCKIAERMNQWNYQTPPSLYLGGGNIKYTLKHSSNGTTYDLTLPFLPPQEIEWIGYGKPVYPNFTHMQDLQCFTIYLDKVKSVVLLVWHSFGENLMNDLETLMEYAHAENLLEYALILDLTTSRGGSKAPFVIQHLTSKSFKTTFGNLRLCDITDKFIQQQTKYNLGYFAKSKKERSNTNKTLDDGTWLMDWLETSVVPALRDGQAYSNNVPFKLTHAPMYSDGILYPAEIHFTGEMVALFGPYGGSQVDQFASIIVDNHLAHTIGMSTGGFSNTWDWSEVIMMNENRPIASYMWSIGHTIRPNGQVLEGNPAKMDDYVPQTRANYLTYRDDLVARAMQHLGLADD